MLTEALTALASTGGSALVTAMVTDGWEGVRARFARLFGRGDARQAEVTAGRLEQSRAALVGLSGADLERAQVEQGIIWRTRLGHLLDEDPGVEADLRALVEEVVALLPAGTVSASDHSAAAGRDMTITASGGGTAAGVIHGDVTPPNPTGPGPAGL